MQYEVDEEDQGAALLPQLQLLRFPPARVGAALVPMARHQTHKPGHGEEPTLCWGEHLMFMVERL